MEEMEGMEVEVANQLTGEEIHSSPPELLPHFQSSSHLSTSSYNHQTQSDHYIPSYKGIRH